MKHCESNGKEAFLKKTKQKNKQKKTKKNNLHNLMKIQTFIIV